MFSSKIHVIETDPWADARNAHPWVTAHPETANAPFVIHGEGNPNMIDGGWDFPKDLGMSRADLYPSKHQRAWYTRLAERWVI